jgi:N-acetylmuramoyl-L-alanine amidase
MMKIVYDIGHGGSDPGAVDPEDREMDDEIYADELYSEESDIVLALSKKLIELSKDNHELFITREEDVYIPLSDRSELANENEVDIFVSLHANAAESQNAKGIETLYYPGSKGGKRLANGVQNRLIKNTYAEDRGIKTRRNLHVLRETNMPAILVEVGFITNLREEILLNCDEYLDLLAKSIYQGVEYYGRQN